MSALTKRENLKRVLAGDEPGWVPCALNFSQWFGHHCRKGTLPPELHGCGDYLDAMRVLDCDIFSRNLDGGFREQDRLLTRQEYDVPTPLGPRRTVIYNTTHGILRMVRQQQEALSTSYEPEHFVKDWSRDGDAFRAWLDQHAYDWDAEVFEALDRRVGDDGLVNNPAGCTPLKMLHNYFGLSYACVFLMDYPEAARALCETYWAKLRVVLQRLAQHPGVTSVILMDNVDTPFYPPDLMRAYWAPYVKDATELMRAHGKYLFVHACGKLAGLSEIFAACRLTGLEGIAHPPLGDWSAAAAQACHPDFVFMGGFSAHEQESMTDAQLRAFYAGYLGQASRRRFIFSSSCQTSIRTTWERIKLARDLCRAWGGQPRLAEVAV